MLEAKTEVQYPGQAVKLSTSFSTIYTQQRTFILYPIRESESANSSIAAVAAGTAGAGVVEGASVGAGKRPPFELQANLLLITCSLHARHGGHNTIFGGHAASIYVD
jgi:hypothetical protein